MINVLFLYWGRKGGGVHYVEKLMDSDFTQHGINVLYSLSTSGDFKGKNINCSYWQKTYVDTFTFLLASLLLPLHMFRLIKFIKRENIQVVYVPMRHLWSPVINPILALYGIPVIHCVHDARPHPGDLRLLWKTVLGIELQFSVGIVTLSTAVTDILTTAYADILSRKKMMQSKLPVFGSLRVPKNEPLKSLKFIFFGRLAPYKGLDILVNSFSKVVGENVSLTIIGSGSIPKGVMPLIEGDHRIELLQGWVSDERLSDILNSHDLMVLPYTEASQSGAIMSAFGAGLPVVVSPVGGLREQVINGTTGLVLDEVSVECLTETLNRLSGSMSEVSELQMNLRNYLHNDPGWGEEVTALAAFFIKVQQGVQ